MVKFVDNLTNWYVRMNRKRLKGSGGRDDCQEALETLYSVLMHLVRMMAPFTPFLTELMYQNLKNIEKVSAPNGPSDSNCKKKSVHYLMLPEVNEALIDQSVERRVATMQTVIETGRLIRDRKTLPLKYPLSEVIVISENEQALDDIASLENFVLEELNCKSLKRTKQKEDFGVSVRPEPDVVKLGKRLKNDSKKVIAALKNLTLEQAQECLKNPTGFKIEGYELEEGEIRLRYCFDKGAGDDQYEAHGEGDLLVLLDIRPTESMLEEGLAREVINRIQKLRKKAKLVPTDSVCVYYSVKKGEELEKAIESHMELISSTLKAPIQKLSSQQPGKTIIAEKADVKGSTLEILIASTSA